MTNQEPDRCAYPIYQSNPLIEEIVVNLCQEDGPLRLDPIVEKVASQGYESARRISKESIWKLVEDGILRFTRDWKVDVPR